MARKLSRRALSRYVADGLLGAVPRKELIQQLAAYLVVSRRTKELDLIIRDINDQLAQRGVISATVIGATELSADVKQAVERFVASKTGARTVSLAAEIDPAVLGGIRIQLPGQELDQTVERQLNILRTRFKKA